MAVRADIKCKGTVVMPLIHSQPSLISAKLLKFGIGRRLPIIYQTEAAECGLACLAMIASFHGYTTDLAHLRHRIHISNHGTNLKHLIDMAARLHLSARALKLESHAIAGLQLPCILHWNLNHFVVLKAVKRNEAIIHDPAAGERTLTKEEFDKYFTGIALELTPTHAFEVAETRKRLGLHHFLSRITGLKRSLLQILTLSFLLQFFAALSPYYMQTVVDDVNIN